ncbi:uncharacterized protein LOC133191386 [Saccostrea echinata]|uniref:uncharacterized protein LOC133191386 n=1 Tax=Saccostrea echinata TaxID=191078 RepID=UPI002A800CE3|nr:uncharacterized protein LOC133191386 [Saccostrea echinata]
MEANEIKVLNRCAKDIKISVLVSSSILQRLEFRGMLSRQDREYLSRLQDSCDRNPKLVEMLKKKKGGYQALTETLLLEKTVNEHYVKKMNNFLKEFNSKHKTDSHCQVDLRPKIKQLELRIEDLEQICEKVSLLVLGEDLALDQESLNMELVVHELEHTRNLVNRRKLPLHRAYNTCKIGFETEKTKLAENFHQKENNFQQTIDELNDKITFLSEEIKMIHKNEDQIIRDLVDERVKERLLRLNLVEPNSEESTPSSINPEAMDFSIPDEKSFPKGVPLSTRSDFLSLSPDDPALTYTERSIHLQINNVENLQLSHQGSNYVMQQTPSNL